MEWRRFLALIGSLEVFIGVFAPIVSLPLLGSANFFGNGQNGTGVVLLILAGGSAILTFLEKYLALWLTGAGALGVVAFTFINFVTDMSRTAATLNAQLANTPLQGLGSVVAQSLQLEWGWGLLFTGGALLVVAAAWPEAGEDTDAPETRTCPDCAEDIKAEAHLPLLRQPTGILSARTPGGPGRLGRPSFWPRGGPGS